MEIAEFLNQQAETFPLDCPLFSALEAQWRAAGRVVPGTVDPEWNRLMQPPCFGLRPPTVRGHRRGVTTAVPRPTAVLGAAS